MKKHEFEYGYIEYRLPNISEAMILMGRMGIDFDKIEETEENQDLIFVGKLIDCMGDFIINIDINIGDETITSYEQCLTNFKLMTPLSEIAQQVISCMEVSEEKKN